MSVTVYLASLPVFVAILSTFCVADDNILQPKSGTKVCVGAICPDGSAFHYYDCCGVLYNECCLRLQTWVIVVLTIIGVLILASIVTSIIKCIFFK